MTKTIVLKNDKIIKYLDGQHRHVLSVMNSLSVINSFSTGSMIYNSIYLLSIKMSKEQIVWIR